jgi:hypothetical protein
MDNQILGHFSEAQHILQQFMDSPYFKNIEVAGSNMVNSLKKWREDFKLWKWWFHV